MTRIRSLYGSVMLERALCPVCQEWSILSNGRTRCCNAICERQARRKAQRMSDAPDIRHGPTSSVAARIVHQQKGRCFYCDRFFSTAVWRKGRILLLKLHWDHFIPWSFSQANPDQNFVAACHVCNGLKRDLVFETPEEAREYIRHGWEKKGYSDSEVSSMR